MPTPAFLDVHRISPTHQHICLTYFARAKAGNAELAEKEHDEIRCFSRADLADAKFEIAPAIRFCAEQALKMDEYIEKSKVC